MACLYQRKWSRFLHWCHGRNSVPCKATFQQLAEFYFYLWKELKLSVSVSKGYRSTCNHVFILSGMDIASDIIVSPMFSSFKRSCPLREIKPLEWNQSLALRNLTHPPYKPLKLSMDKHLSRKTCFLLPSLSVRWVSKLLPSPTEFVTRRNRGLAPFHSSQTL